MLINNIHTWINELLIPRLELDNLPICPYARQALNIYYLDSCSFENIEEKVSKVDIDKHKVCIFYFEQYQSYKPDVLENKTLELNTQLNSKDIVILDNDPRVPFYINDVKTTFDGCYLWLAQSLSDLNIKSQDLKNKTNYYSFWTKEQMDSVVNWRSI